MNNELFFNEILTNEAISTVFQPIISLENGIVFGYEALSRISIPTSGITTEELFQIAHQQNRLWDLEKLCRTKALENASIQSMHSILFINVDASTLQDPKFRSGFTVEKIIEYGISASSIVIELTEQRAIMDMSSFVSTVQHYQGQGFQIAIDDFGSGYSGLNRVCELAPSFLKIDINLIRDIHKDRLKRAAVNSTVEFCRKSGIQVIAEGIECEEELKTVIQLGVDFAQGYYLCRPSHQLSTLRSECIKQIVNLSKRTQLQYQRTVFCSIGDLGTKSQTAQYHSPSLPLFDLMKANLELSEYFVLDEQSRVCGILTRHHIFEKFGGQYGFILSKRMNAGDIMIAEVLTVDEKTPVEHVSKIAMQRSLSRVYDSIAVTRQGKYHSTVSVRELLLISIHLQLQRATDVNPLTGLPGNHEIQNMIESVFLEKSPWAIIYLDLDNFKAYNDAFGFTNGDSMLKALADSMRHCVEDDDFLGHIGGDDFVIITSYHDVTWLCESIQQEFFRMAKPLYPSKDWENGFFTSQDRNGFKQDFPIASLSIAVVTNRITTPTTIDELSILIAQAKKESKMRQGGAIVIN
jgi:EAL domain-containing protein (putative c-di-GMP-specific phosphodiesterase class I)/GGDEF domain-containing protein